MNRSAAKATLPAATLALLLGGSAFAQSTEDENAKGDPDGAGGNAEDEAERPGPVRESAAPENTPWGKGVSAAERDRARALLDEGNQLFLDAEHREALAHYERALKAWDHPAIRFNIVRVLIKLDEPVEAYEHLQEALRYGEAPLEERVYEEAKNYEQLLLGQIAEIEVSCSQQGVRVTLDGEAFLRCPGNASTRILPGSHAVVGRKKHHLTLTRDVVAMPGETERVDLELVPIDEATVERRRWAAWKPWAVTGGGAGLAGLGVLLQLQAQADMERYGDALEQQCGEAGCPPGEIPESTQGLETRARIESGVAIGAMVAGGIAVATGLGLVWANQPHAVVPDESARAEHPAVTPTVSARSIGLELSTSF